MDERKMPDKDKILEQLHAGPTRVVFKKVDGELREMNCTLMEDLLPPRPQEESTTPARKENPDVQSVWDIDKAAWRSFRWANIVEDK
jgi:hypothetical protein